jgi:hypothetical protein
MASSPLTIVVSGMIAADPHQGGATWAVLQYVLGLRDLGHRVLLVEPIKPSQIAPSSAALSESINASYFRRVAADFGLEDEAALLHADSRITVGIEYARLQQMVRGADLLLNISGMLTDEELIDQIPVRAFLDLDPAFVQFWNAQGIDMGLGRHTHFVTVGQAIGEFGCVVPTLGRKWLPTLQPIVLRHWPLGNKIVYDGFTTIGNWRGYGSIEYQGVHYGQKAHSLRQFMDLPTRTSEKFLMALAIDPGESKDLVDLERSNWRRLNPAVVAGTPQAYQVFIQGSKGELGIAKSGYVQSRCGWFSDRSVCYLASGRPVIAQETGFSQYLPTGEGLFRFETTQDILAALDAINRDYAKQRRAAAAIAEEYFCSDEVLTRLLQLVGGVS